MELFVILGITGLAIAWVLGRRYRLPFAWAALAVYAGMLSSAPLGSLKSDPDITFLAFRYLGVLLILAVVAVLVRDPGFLRWHRGTGSILPFALVGIPLFLAGYSAVIGLWRGNDMLLLVGDALRLALTGFAVAFGLALADRARTARLAIVMALTMLISEAIVGVIYLFPAAFGLPATVRTGGGLGAVLALGLVGLLNRDGRQLESPSPVGDDVGALPTPSIWPTRVQGAVIVALVVMVSARSLTRGTWLAVAVALVAVVLTYAFVWTRADAVKWLVGLFAAVLVLVAIAVATFGGFASSVDYVAVRLTQSDEAATSSSARFREAEITYTNAHLDSIPLGHELGAGAGATYYYPYADQVDRHQVHFLVFNFRFRSGILGATSYVVWSLLVFGACFVALWRSKDRPLVLWAAITVLFTAVQGITAQRLIGEAVPAFALGIVAYGALVARRTRVG